MHLLWSWPSSWTQSNECRKNEMPSKKNTSLRTIAAVAAEKQLPNASGTGGEAKSTRIIKNSVAFTVMPSTMFAFSFHSRPNSILFFCFLLVFPFAFQIIFVSIVDKELHRSPATSQLPFPLRIVYSAYEWITWPTHAYTRNQYQLQSIFYVPVSVLLCIVLVLRGSIIIKLLLLFSWNVFRHLLEPLFFVCDVPFPPVAGQRWHEVQHSSDGKNT